MTSRLGLEKAPDAWPQGRRSMSFEWPDLHHRLVRYSSSLRSQQQFGALRTCHRSLQRFRDPPALLEYLHHGTALPEAKNAILRSLVRGAQAEDGNTALTLILLALWPGLDAVRRRVIRRWPWDGNEAAADLLARVCDAIRTLDLHRVTWIAVTVLRNIERDVGRRMRRESKPHDRHAATEADNLPSLAIFTNPLMSEALLQQDLEQLCGRDGDLVTRVVLMSQTQAEAGAVLGLTEAAARKRYQRATHRLQETLH